MPERDKTIGLEPKPWQQSQENSKAETEKETKIKTEP
jgi:hypothetical protein